MFPVKKTSLSICLAICMATPTVAHAHGGLGSLIILAYPILILTGLVGVCVAALLVSKILRNTGGVVYFSRGWKIVALLYIVWAAVLYHSIDTSEISFMQLIGAAALINAMLLGVLYLKPRYKRTLAVYMLIVSLWGVHWLALYEVTFVDNAAAIDALRITDEGRPGRQLLFLSDGRRVLQVEPVDLEKRRSDFWFTAADYAALKEMDSERPGKWFEVNQYREKEPGIFSGRRTGSAHGFALFEIELPGYELLGTPTAAVVLDGSGIAVSRELLLLVLGEPHSLSITRELLSAGSIDIHSQAFIDAAFESEKVHTYLTLAALGVGSDVADANGNTLLHRLAYIGDPDAMWDFYERSGEADRTNMSGHTPLEVFRIRHGNSRIAMRRLNSYPW
jgi:hypothetical protein